MINAIPYSVRHMKYTLMVDVPAGTLYNYVALEKITLVLLRNELLSFSFSFYASSDTKKHSMYCSISKGDCELPKQICRHFKYRFENIIFSAWFSNNFRYFSQFLFRLEPPWWIWQFNEDSISIMRSMMDILLEKKTIFEMISLFATIILFL